MIEYLYTVEEPIAALSTPWGESAIAVIRTSGGNTLTLINRIFKPFMRRTGDAEPGNKVSPGKIRVSAKSKGSTLHYGKIIDSDSGEILDDVMLALYRAPASYTGEDSAEIFCHGSLAVITRILALLYKCGFRPAQAGEFTLRAFLNGKMDLTRAEAVNELIRSRSDKARALALNRLSGTIERKITEIKLRLVNFLSSVEVRLDYPDEDIEGEVVSEKECSSVENELKQLISSYETGRLFQEGVTAVLAGRTNAGKSTLFNLLLKEERSIVSRYHGTTRDYIEGNIVVAGIPVRVFDTAGLRKGGGPVEMEGVRRSNRVIKGADFILYLVDASFGLTEEDTDFIKSYSGSYGGKGKIIKVWNKIDLKSTGGVKAPDGFLPLSAETGTGLDKLVKRIEQTILHGTPVRPGEPVIDSIRQKELLDRTLDALRRFKRGLKRNDPLDAISVELQEAVHLLGEITGEVTSQDILNNIFSNFCVGK
ncbi:MAG: tRNA uridine-5-carboxymethylaminomethyl(34) synthesis GTPase MnmE [Spirochaetes bacterium]|nr:tRNA uridine-5-carboxymethylaminomethyl(34) synthesis GTPase MnmE [Spirochaetota bacterium]